jgi:diadenylate cyclase
VENFFGNLIDQLVFVFQRINWLSVIDIALVTLIFVGILLLLRETHAMVLLRGVLLLVALVSLLTSLDVLPAFSWLVKTTLPALVVAIPVIFAPEIRRGLERLGRAGSIQTGSKSSTAIQNTITIVVSSSLRLSDRGHGALIVLRRLDSLDEFVRTGIALDARV